MYSACLHLYLITLSERLKHFLFVKWPTCSFLHINYPVLWNEIGKLLSTNTRSNCISDLFNEWKVCIRCYLNVCTCTCNECKLNQHYVPISKWPILYRLCTLMEPFVNKGRIHGQDLYNYNRLLFKSSVNLATENNTSNTKTPIEEAIISLFGFILAVINNKMKMS